MLAEIYSSIESTNTILFPTPSTKNSFPKYLSGVPTPPNVISIPFDRATVIVPTVTVAVDLPIMFVSTLKFSVVTSIV